MARRLLVAALLLALLSLRLAAEDARAAKAEQVLHAAIAADGPGAMVAVVVDGEVVFRESAGLADVEAKRAFTPETTFDLASCTKQFTAMAVLMLAEKGALSLDDDIRKHLPEFPEHKRPIRVIDLLHMTAGPADYMDLVESFDGVRNEDILKLVAPAKLRFPTGTKYEYSNTDYNLLGTIVHRVSGKTYGEFLEEAIFRPTGMTHSAVLERKGQEIPSRATGYVHRKKGWVVSRDDTPGIVGDGSLFSTVDDLVLWDRALRQGKLVKPDTLAIAFTSGKLESGEETGYACGWDVGDEGGHRWAWHAGGWDGTATYVARQLDGKVSVIVLSNDEKLDAGGLGDNLAKVYTRR